VSGGSAGRLQDRRRRGVAGAVLAGEARPATAGSRRLRRAGGGEPYARRPGGGEPTAGCGCRVRGSPPAPSSAPSAHKGGRSPPTAGGVGRRTSDNRRERWRGLGGGCNAGAEGAHHGPCSPSACSAPPPRPDLRREAWRGGGLGTRWRVWVHLYPDGKRPKMRRSSCLRSCEQIPTAPGNSPRMCRGWPGRGGRMPVGASAARGGSWAGWLAGRRSGGGLGGEKCFPDPRG